MPEHDLKMPCPWVPVHIEVWILFEQTLYVRNIVIVELSPFVFPGKWLLTECIYVACTMTFPKTAMLWHQHMREKFSCHCPCITIP
jgi:hypothetical protein